jgi:hypothetical protein
MQERPREHNAQQLDTTALQRTHWNQGDVPGATVSEYRRSYHDSGVDCRREQEVTQAMMMGTHFSLADGRSRMERPAESYTAADVTAPANLKEQMVATHFDLTNPASVPRWETTHAADFVGRKAAPATPPHMELQRGLGAKATFDNLSAFAPAVPLYTDSFPERRAQTASGRVPRATIEDDRISFAQGTTQRWQRTNFDLGDGVPRFATTSGDALPGHRSDTPDRRYAREKRLAAGRSCAMQGFNLETVKTTTTEDATAPHPEHRPPPEAERTAFVSHQDHRNWNQPVSTTHRDTFYPKVADRPEPINNQLQASHGTFANPAIREVTTLYDASFAKPPSTAERADMDAARGFHMGHHSTNRSGQSDRLPQTEYRASYAGHPGLRPSDICEGLKGGHNIVASDPRFVLTKSAMDTDYVAHPGGQRPPPIDNSLQDSHLQLKGGALPWTTTQQDYFQYETYRMPNRPF